MESGDEDIKLGSGSWLTGRRVLIGLAVLAFAIFLWQFPSWALKRADDKFAECTNNLFTTGDGEASDCPHRGLLVIPKLIPWTRKKAKALEAQMDYLEAEDALKIAAVRTLDAKARDRAAGHLLDTLREKPHHAFTASSRLLSAGAERIALDRAADLDADERGYLLPVAARLGDRAALERIAKIAGSGRNAPGIAMCFLGDTKGGLALLAKADAEFMTATNSHDQDTQWAKLGCDPTQQVDVDEVWQPRVDAVRAVLGHDRAGFGEGHMNDTNVQMLAVAFAATDGRPADDLLQIIRPKYDDAMKPTIPLFTPWSMLGFSPDEWPSAPALFDDAAARLVTLAQTTKPPKPKKKSADDDPYSTDGMPDEVKQHPAEFLRYGALILDLQAAVGWTRRGQLAKAHEAATRALELTHDPAMGALGVDPSFAVSTLELVGDWSTAEAELAPLMKMKADGDTRILLAIQLALAQAHAGKLADADATLAPVFATRADMVIVTQLQWLHAAFALALHKPINLELPHAKAKLSVVGKPDETLAYWLDAAAATAEKQRHVRWDSFDDVSSTYDVQAVMPALFFVVGQSAGSGDVELWLDTITGRSFDDPQAVASARAEAARWRGDAAAAKRWDDRLAAMRALATDDRSAHLLDLLFKP